MLISDWSSDVCSSDLVLKPRVLRGAVGRAAQAGIEAGKRTADLVDPRDRLVDVLPDAGARARERLGKRAELIGDLARRCQKGVTRRAGCRIGRKVLRGVVEAGKLPAQSLGIIVEIGLDLIESALPCGRTRIIKIGRAHV